MVPRRLICMLFTITLATSFQFGYQTGVINEPLSLISDFIGNVSATRYGIHDDAFITTMASLCVTTFLIGGLVGALGSGALANKFGRKTSILYMSFPCLAGCVMLMTSKIAHSFEMIISGRFLIGLACGVYTAIAPVYMSEISPASLRGAAGVLNQLVVVASLVVAQLLGLPPIMGKEELWPILLGLSGVPCIVGTLLLLLFPESPRYIYLTKRNRAAAREALHSLRNPGDDIDIELREFDEENAGTTRKAAFTDIWKQPHLRMALLVVVVSQIGQQFSGLNGLLYYSVELFKSNGLSDSEATYATIGIGGVLLVITTVSVFIIDRLGRRLLLIGGLLDAFFCLIIFTECLIIKQITGMHWPVYIAITCLFIFVCGFAIGPGSIPWFLVAEMLPQENRDAALSITMAVNWLCNICLGLGFIQLIKYIDIYAFLPSVCAEFIVICILWNYMPETMGRSVMEVEAEFKRMTRRNGAHVLIESDVTEGTGSPVVRPGSLLSSYGSSTDTDRHSLNDQEEPVGYV
ncbi:hypothetical protein CRM22_009813 [Opisthorchis felineus]|uniref:Major facilitator superfamily (MFS) profile domain-containing protein n=2 Tax=Opisthorchis felineus TaxID=147828 RepID=A0A4S2LBB6_OPIFE|nr:hypothetical protein CRM22_009813 [Opisthorchis felineus]